MMEFDIWYSLVRFSNRDKLSLLKKFKSTENIWRNVCNNKLEVDQDKNIIKLRHILKKYWDENRIKEIKNILTSKNIEIINYYSENYPKNLKPFEDAPSILYYRGDIEKINSNKNLAIVGSRDYSYYGENVTSIISREMAKNNINIISGMAKGIDAFAHKYSLQAKGYTCAVLGSGIDVIYPYINKNIYYKLLEEGSVISEFLPGIKPYPYNFPLRNRIISGLSDAVIIIEASEKSGSLITASCALEQGKDVMAVPGSIFSKKSIGTNKLIKDGAYPFTTIEDIYNLLNINYKEKIEIEKNNLNKIENEIYTVIEDTPIHIDDIVRVTKVDIKRLYEVLFELQFKNHITCLSGNYYVRISNSI
ncbi:DNA-protecting protein DprA [Clostridium tetani]|nr:DNA-processing protein DprA [Clostridium tetani]QBD84821.1 DNA-protecting protein DprA [Clostridium tetani]QBD87173.1 DNA-protecting protein DprA [Clostridium tetani]RXI63101.1 DNA-protecting protein DprA [Clostridium tetani]RXI63623.1 DNA-protecting protein DprA [Clostridium tetani]RXI66337.1 DNA-protecting protein DprA [Clostridium tetani]